MVKMGSCLSFYYGDTKCQQIKKVVFDHWWCYKTFMGGLLFCLYLVFKLANVSWGKGQTHFISILNGNLTLFLFTRKLHSGPLMFLYIICILCLLFSSLKYSLPLFPILSHTALRARCEGILKNVVSWIESASIRFGLVQCSGTFFNNSTHSFDFHNFFTLTVFLFFYISPPRLIISVCFVSSISPSFIPTVKGTNPFPPHHLASYSVSHRHFLFSLALLINWADQVPCCYVNLPRHLPHYILGHLQSSLPPTLAFW